VEGILMMSTPVQTLHNVLGAAIYRDLPQIEYHDRDWTKWRALSKEEQLDAIKNNTVPGVMKTRRPREDDVEVYLFPQTWGSTALGYGGIGGSAMTTAYTVVVMNCNDVCVYFGASGFLAYKFNMRNLSTEGLDRFQNDLITHNIADCREYVKRYK
jgi:hypothetical protein